MTFVRLSLAGTHAEALVDESDVDCVSGFNWRLHADGYAAASVGSRTVYLHREVLGLKPGDGVQADHINRDRLDNRRANLRAVTNAQNCQNRPAHGDGYRGVYWNAERGLWAAKMKLNYQHHFLGLHADEIDAARAAEAFRRAHMPFSVPDPDLDPVGACCCAGCRPDRSCEFCEATFTPSNSRQRFCSKRCACRRQRELRAAA